MTEEQRKGMFWFCYPFYKVLWAARTSDEIEQAKSLLKDKQELYINICKGINYDCR